MEQIDNSYYEILGLEKSATQAQIRKAYYNKARTSHPDKNLDNPKAEEEFKLLSEAYTVLYDQEKRDFYDKFGKAGVMQNGGEDQTTIIKSIFGGDKFEDCWGNLVLFTLMINPDGKEINDIHQYVEEMQQENKKNLVKILVTKLQSFLDNTNMEALNKDIQEKVEAPGGPALLKLIGDIYITKSRQYIGRLFGFQGFLESWAEKGRLVGHIIKVMGTVIDLQRMQAEVEASGEALKPDDQAKIAKLSLNAMWTMGKIEIDRLVNTVCEEAITENHLTAEEVKIRAMDLEKLGEMYISAAEKCNNEKLIM